MHSKIRISTPKNKSGILKKSQDNFKYQNSTNQYNKMAQTNNINNFFLGNLHERQNPNRSQNNKEMTNKTDDNSTRIKSKSFLNKTHSTYNNNNNHSMVRKFKEMNNRFNESVQVSSTEIGCVKAYSVVTTDGIFRKTNEDRVSIYWLD